jgi:hypothetical protein
MTREEMEAEWRARAAALPPLRDPDRGAAVAALLNYQAEQSRFLDEEAIFTTNQEQDR